MKLSIIGTLVVMALACGCGGEEASPLVVTWKFPTGDCTSNGVANVRITVSPEAGEKKTADSACSAGQVNIGVFPAGTYSVLAEGLDSTGTVVAQNFGNSATWGDSGPFGGLDVTLNPKPSEVVVTWSFSNGSKCPPNVQLPYFISIYRPPATGTTLTDKVKEVQESCSSGTATLSSIVPGDYVVEIDSRAVTPKVRGTKAVTVKAGQDAAVAIQF